MDELPDVGTGSGLQGGAGADHLVLAGGLLAMAAVLGTTGVRITTKRR